LDCDSVGLEFDTEPEEEDEVRAPAAGGTRKKEAAAARGWALASAQEEKGREGRLQRWARRGGSRPTGPNTRQGEKGGFYFFSQAF